jgi:biopolymer transport protein ExbD
LSFFKNNQEETSENINITPLIDVVFLLLLFFILTTTFTSLPGFKINLPKSQSASQEKTNNINIFISEEGQISFDSKQINIKDLELILKEKAKIGTDQMVIISADQNSKHGLIVNIMDKIKESGFSKITIATRKK